MASSLVNNKYRITKRIGGGSFGEIYMGVGPNGEKVAVKFERHGTRCPQLRHEYKVYRELTNCHGFCQVYHFGTQDNYNVMVMDLLGPSLEDLFNKCQRRFSLKTVLQIADQMLERVDTLHSRHLIHRDIKPANFVIGHGETAANIYCVDFGLSKRYRHPKNLQHIPHRDGRSLTGTPRYASINNHLGIEQSRRDDLESIGYVLIYFLKGSLPWQGLKAKNAQKKYRLILEKKQQVSIAQLCQGCPSQFAEFLAYTRSLKFDAKPDIPYLRKLFRDLYHAQNCGAIPKLWDWDGMDLEHTSTAGSAAGNGGPVGPAPALVPANPQPIGLRPTTAAAVISSGNGIDADLLMGPGDRDDLDEDYNDPRVHGMGDRPNTAGAMLQSRPANNAAAWGYPRQGDPKVVGGGDPYGEGPNARRPHTAHGARAGFPVQSNMGFGAGMNDPKGGIMYAEQEVAEDGNHVVAGAREMMRYRRNRATTIEATGNPGAPPQGGMPMMAGPGQQPVYGAGGMAGVAKPNNGGWSGGEVGGANPNQPWAVYQNAGKGVPVNAMTATQQAQAAAQARKTPVAGQQPVPTSAAGWSPFTSDRPKSAVATSSGSGAIPTTASGGGGIVSALTGGGSRPTTSTQPQAAAMPGGGGQWGGSNTASNPALATNSNTLSYGSLKNRFLSGASKNNGTAATAAATGAAVNTGGVPTNTATSSGKSKLFSLAR